MSNATEILRAAKRLLELGLPPVLCCCRLGEGRCSASWHPVPCDRIGKRPLMQGYPTFARTPPRWNAVESLMRRVKAANLGIVTGSRYVVIEADSGDAEVEIAGLAGPSGGPIRERRPGRGRGWIFLLPRGVTVPNRAKLGESGAIDVRGEGGLFIVPPSVHAHGHRYKWTRAPWDWPPVPIAARLLRLALEGSATTSGPPAHVVRTIRGQLSPRVAFLLKSKGRLALMWQGEGRHHGDLSASGYDLALARELLASGVSEAETAAALLARPGAHRHDAGYVARTVGLAASLGPGRRRSR